MTRLFLAGCFLLCFALAASAQESLRIGEPFTLVADHDGAETTEFWVETLAPGLSAPVVTEKRPATQLANGQIAFPYPTGIPAAAPLGTYQIQIVAVGPNGTARSPILQFVLTPASGTAPVAPGMPRIIR